MRQHYDCQPELIGPRELPRLRKMPNHYDVFSKSVSLQLPDLPENVGMAIKYPNREQLKIGRKRILMAAARIYGYGRVQTGSDENILYVWLIERERVVAETVRNLWINKSREGFDEKA